MPGILLGHSEWMSDTLMSAVIDSITTRKYPVHFGDSTFSAVVSCSGIYKKNQVDWRMELQVRNIRKHEDKWIITSANGKLFDVFTRDSSFFISPALHGVSFMSLPGDMRVNKNLIVSLTDDNYQVDNLSLLFGWLYSGSLVIDKVTHVEYLFKHIPGYILYVKQNNTMKRVVSGWQIYRIEKL